MRTSPFAFPVAALGRGDCCLVRGGMGESGQPRQCPPAAPRLAERAAAASASPPHRGDDARPRRRRRHRDRRPALARLGLSRAPDPWPEYGSMWLRSTAYSGRTCPPPPAGSLASSSVCRAGAGWTRRTRSSDPGATTPTSRRVASPTGSSRAACSPASPRRTPSMILHPGTGRASGHR